MFIGTILLSVFIMLYFVMILRILYVCDFSRVFSELVLVLCVLLFLCMNCSYSLF